jgi:hypothetical protein
MISDIQYLNDTSSFDSDDLLSLPDDLLSLPVGFISQNEYNEYSIVYDDIIKKEIFASLEVNHSKLYSIFLHNITHLFFRLIKNNHQDH